MNWLQRTVAKMIFGYDMEPGWGPGGSLGPYIETKESAAGPTISATHVGQPRWSDRDFLHFAQEGYVENAIAFRCIQLIAQSAAAAPLVAMKKAKKQEADPIIELLNRPSPNATGSELIESLTTYLRIAGNAYLEAVSPSRKDAPPRELYSHRPDRIRVVPGRTGLPMAFEYEANGYKTRWDVDPVTGTGPMLQLKTFNPVNDWYGLSPMEPAAKSIDQHNEASNHNMAVLQNGAVPSGALTFRPITSEGQVISAPPNVIQAAEKHLEARHQGARNAGRPLVTNGHVEWVQFSQTMEQLQLSESMLESARNICNAYGVPFILLVPGQSTYNNVREAKLALYEETVLPGLDWLMDHLNIWLVPKFGSDVKLVVDKDSLDALSPRREENRKTYIELFEKKLVKRDEVREALSFDPMEGRGDFDAQSYEVTAVTALMNASKLSKETGWKQLASWGILPEELSTPEGAADEQERLDSEAEASMANGLLGLDADPETGAPLDPSTGKPKTQAAPSAVPRKPGAVPVVVPKPKVAA